MTDRIPLDDLTSDRLDALYDQLDAAEESEAQRQLATARDAFASATVRAARAEAAIARVRALHHQDGAHCAICTEDFGRLSAPWPCPTIRALDEEQPAPGADGLHVRHVRVDLHNVCEYSVNRAALCLVDFIRAEFPGVHVTTDAREWDERTPGPGATAAAQATDDTELTAEEARALVDELGTDLYQAQDALAFVGECCDIADREQRTITTDDVREWLKGARCGRQLAADGHGLGEKITAMFSGPLPWPPTEEPCAHCQDRRHPHRACDPDHLRTELAWQQAVNSDYRVENQALRDKLARFHEGEQPHTDERLNATPAQWIWRWNRATPAERLEVAARLQDAADRADRCFLGNHEARLDQQHTAARRVTELEETLRDVLSQFVHKGHPGEPCLQTGWISVKTVDRWRTILNPPPPIKCQQCQDRGIVPDLSTRDHNGEPEPKPCPVCQTKEPTP